MRILHTSDLHINLHKRESLTALDEIVRTCKEKEVDVLVISGDLLDTPARAFEVAPVVREKLSQFQGKIIAIPGNHDHSALSTIATSLGVNFEILSRPGSNLTIGEITFWALPHSEELLERDRLIETITNLAEAIRSHSSPHNFLLFHGEIRVKGYHWEFQEEESRYITLEQEMLTYIPVSLILAGHHHTLGTFQVETREGEVKVLYPGSPWAVRVSDEGKRNVILIEVGSKAPEVKTETLNVPYVHTERVYFTLEDNPLQVLSNIFEGKDPLARIHLTVAGVLGASELYEQTFSLLRDAKEKGIIEEFSSESLIDISHLMKDRLFTAMVEKARKKFSNNPDMFNRALVLLARIFDEAVHSRR